MVGQGVSRGNSTLLRDDFFEFANVPPDLASSGPEVQINWRLRVSGVQMSNQLTPDRIPWGL